MSSKLLIFTRSYLVGQGLASLIRREYTDVEINVLNSLEFKDEIFNHLIIDSSILPEPFKYSLDRLYSHYKQPGILLCCPVNPPEDLLVYLEGWFHLSFSETELLAEFKKLFSEKYVNANVSEQNTVLSDREREVLRAVALGLTNKEISDELYISTHTVITHRKNITAKLGIKTIAGLAVYAVLNGIISAEEMTSKDS